MPLSENYDRPTDQPSNQPILHFQKSINCIDIYFAKVQGDAHFRDDNSPQPQNLEHHQAGRQCEGLLQKQFLRGANDVCLKNQCSDLIKTTYLDIKEV